jgi:hypothetical protein
MKENEFTKAVDDALFGEGEMTEVNVATPQEAREASNGEGYVYIGDLDDPIVAVFARGVLVGTAYASYRGVYQAGAWDGRQGYAKTDSAALAHTRNVPFEEWYMVGEREDICVSIAHDAYNAIEDAKEDA